MSEEKLIVESKVKALLMKLPGVKSVGQEVLDQMSRDVRIDAELALSTKRVRLTPGGRLLCALPEEAPKAVAPGGAMVGGEVAVDAEWGPYHEWQAERRSGRTKLPFEEWKEQRK